jgi:hypothetical protein
MKRVCLALSFACVLSVSVAAFGQEGSVVEATAAPLNERLKVFEPLLGKTFRGEFANSTPEKPIVDVAKWERALNGQAVRTLHSVNDGLYGGESIIMWDPKEERLVFWYFTTAGFFTKGSFEIDGAAWTSIEEVTGDANGITKVKSVSTWLENGELQTEAEYFANGEWKPGRSVIYKAAPDAVVVFK